MPWVRTLRRPSTLAALLLALLLAFVTAHLLSTRGTVSGDTVRLMQGVGALDYCLHVGRRPCPEIQQWPLLQYLPSLAVKRLGGSSGDAIDVLRRLNGLAVLATLALLWTLGRRSGVPGGGFLGLLIALASPLLWYGESTFGEGLATFFVTLYVVALLLRWHPAVVVVAMIVAGISKETALPFLLAFGLVALRSGRSDGGRSNALRASLLVGAAAVVALTVAFNLFRYGVPYNRVYTDPDYLVSSVWRRLDFAAAYFAAPDPGLIWTWPSATLVILAAVVRPHATRRNVLLAIAVLFLLVGSFSNWWTPFGWIAWGARFSTPWIAVVASIALVAIGTSQQREAILARLTSWPVALVAASLVLAFGVAQFSAFLNPLAAISAPANSASPCSRYPSDPEVAIAAGDRRAASIAAACAHDRAWNGYGERHAFAAIGATDLPWVLLFTFTTAAAFVAFTQRARYAVKRAPA